MEYKRGNVLTDTMKHSSQIKNFEIWVEDYDSEDIFTYQYYINRFKKIQAKYNLEKKMTFKIHSYGGSAHGVFSLISTVESLKSEGWTIVTIGLGMSMSAGGMLLMSGSKGHRYVQSLTEVMLHDQNWFEYGYKRVEDARRSAIDAERLLDRLKMLMARYTDIDIEYFENEYVSKMKDFYMYAEEAVELGVVDKIL